jgi:ATP-binding cassette, subfamily B, bacterial
MSEPFARETSMSENTQPLARGFVAEIRLIIKRAHDVNHLVPRKQKLALSGAALVMSVTSASNTVIAIALGRMVDGVSSGTDAGTASRDLYRLAVDCLLVIAGAYVVREFLNVWRRYLVENTCGRLTSDMNLRLISHMMKINLQKLSGEKVGTLHARMIRSVDGLIRFIRLSFLDFFPAVFTGVIALIAAISKSPVLGLTMIGVVPLAVYLTVRQMMSQKGVRLALMRDCEEIDGLLIEQMGGIEYVRAAHTSEKEIARLAEGYERRRRREIRHHFHMSLYSCAKAMNEGFFHVLVLGVSIYLAIQGTISFGDVLTFSVLFLNVMAPLTEVHRVIDEGHEASLRVGDLLDMLNEPEDASFITPEPAEPQLAAGNPIIELEDLFVEYAAPTGKLHPALRGISLSIRHGETIGVAGRSGCGKSTWIKVLLRLTHPQQGTVRLGGIPLERVRRETIGQLIGYVGQQPFVFTGTIADNIAYSNNTSSLDEIRRAAELANIHEEIMMLPGAYDAVVAERGQNLSGGQRQRLSIARVLLKQPPILILDEATSALDNISERLVQRALGVRDANRTTILVAHRLSTLRDADRILVFDDGQIVEVGNYGELLTRGGVFANLVASAENGIDAAPEPIRAAG